MRTQETGLTRRTVTLTEIIIGQVKKQAEAEGREFSAELRRIIRKGLGK